MISTIQETEGSWRTGSIIAVYIDSVRILNKQTGLWFLNLRTDKPIIKIKMLNLSSRISWLILLTTLLTLYPEI